MIKIITNICILLFAIIISGCATKNEKYSNKKNENIVKKLTINEIDYESPLDIDVAEKLLEKSTDLQSINTINWSEFPYKPEVEFRIAYCQDNILLKYYVTEDNIVAKETKVNGDVYKDSCVEFFISPDQNDIYYNFEFNCIGIPHVGYGKVGTKKALIDPEILKSITIRSSLGNQPFDEKKGGHQWEMMIIIPKKCFAFDKDMLFKGLKANANFYKCGDDTSVPHFVTWNPVGTEVPDYHQPKYFGEILFK